MPQSLIQFLKRWLITTVAVLVATQVVPGIRYDHGHPDALILATLALGLLNLFIRPVLLRLSLPLLLVTLGLFTLVINAGLLMFVGRIFQNFHVDDFSAAFWGSVVIAIVSTLLNTLSGTWKVRGAIQTSAPAKSPLHSSRNDKDGEGPVIDI